MQNICMCISFLFMQHFVSKYFEAQSLVYIIILFSIILGKLLNNIYLYLANQYIKRNLNINQFWLKRFV